MEHQSKDGSQAKVFNALEWMATTCSHVPGKGEQMGRYYGYDSNVSRGKRKKAKVGDAIPCILEPEITDKAFRRNWARLIQKIYEVDPLTCPRCSATEIQPLPEKNIIYTLRFDFQVEYS